MNFDKNTLARYKRLLTAVAWVLVIGVIVYHYTAGGGNEVPVADDSDAASADTEAVSSPASQFATQGDYNTPGSTTVAGDVEAVMIPGGTPNQTVTYPGFTVHYNSHWHLPNCVVYTLTASETRGRSERQETFEKDENVWGCAAPEEYAGTGYDRGHMAPAGDFKWSDEAMESTFKMSNVCPQDHQLNKGAWNDLEIKVREWARRDKKLVIYTGPVFADKKNPEKITRSRSNKKGRVAVPTAFYKIIYAPTARPARAIAFIMPNEPCDDELKNYVVTIDEVERLTGLDFLSSLPAERQKQLQSTSNTAVWFYSR